MQILEKQLHSVAAIAFIQIDKTATSLPCFLSNQIWIAICLYIFLVFRLSGALSFLTFVSFVVVVGAVFLAARPSCARDSHFLFEEMDDPGSHFLSSYFLTDGRGCNTQTPIDASCPARDLGPSRTTRRTNRCPVANGGARWAHPGHSCRAAVRAGVRGPWTGSGSRLAKQGSSKSVQKRGDSF